MSDQEAADQASAAPVAVDPSNDLEIRAAQERASVKAQLLEMGFLPAVIDQLFEMCGPSLPPIDALMGLATTVSAAMTGEPAVAAPGARVHRSTAFAPPRQQQSTQMKMVIVVRKDLGMGVGKIAAQVAHGAVAAVLASLSGGRHASEHTSWFSTWLSEGQRKIVVSCKDELELRELERLAGSHGLPANAVRDAGLTQVDPGTTTVLCVGPGPADRMDLVTGDLALL